MHMEWSPVESYDQNNRRGRVGGCWGVYPIFRQFTIPDLILNPLVHQFLENDMHMKLYPSETPYVNLGFGGK